MIRVAILLICLALASASVPHAQVTKQVYFSPIDTVVVNGEPVFRSRCFGLPGGRSIDLRLNGAVSTGVMLCQSDNLPSNMTGVVSITNALDGSVSPIVKGLIRLAIGASDVNELTAATFDKLVFQLLIDLPNAKAGLWKPIRPGKDGKYHIHFGQEFQQTAWLYPHIMDNGLVADAQNVMLAAIEPAVAWAASFSENFNCADSATLTCQLTWTKWNGTGCSIVSNQVSCSGNQSTTVRADSDTNTDDHDVQMTLVDLTRGTTDVMQTLTCRKDSTTTGTYYALEAILTGANVGDWTLYKRVAGTRTDLNTNTADPVDGDVMLLRCNGSTITGLVNGSTMNGPVTDSAITGNTRGGFRFNASDAGSSAIIDNFSILDIPVGSASFFPRRRVS